MEVVKSGRDREYRGFKDLKVYQLVFQLSLEIIAPRFFPGIIFFGGPN